MRQDGFVLVGSGGSVSALTTPPSEVGGGIEGSQVHTTHQKPVALKSLNSMRLVNTGVRGDDTTLIEWEEDQVIIVRRGVRSPDRRIGPMMVVKPVMRTMTGFLVSRCPGYWAGARIYR